MPTYISDRGVLHPAKERVGLTNYSDKTFELTMEDKDGKPFKQIIHPGDAYIYEGPCRAALFELWQADKSGAVTTFGSDFRKNPDFIEAYGKARATLGLKDMDEYLVYLGYNEEEEKKKFENKAAKLTKHELPKRISEIKMLGGGSDQATGQHRRYGGYGDFSDDLRK